MHNLLRVPGLCVFLGIVAWPGLGHADAPTPPAKSWRAKPVATAASQVASLVQPLESGGDAAFFPTITDGNDPWFAFKSGALVGTPQWMLSFGGLNGRADVVLEFQKNATVSASVPTNGWQSLGTFEP